MVPIKQPELFSCESSQTPVEHLREVLSRTVRPDELDEAVEWAILSGEDEESVRPFVEWSEEYGPTTAHEVAQLSFALACPSRWRVPER